MLSLLPSLHKLTFFVPKGNELKKGKNLRIKFVFYSLTTFCRLKIKIMAAACLNDILNFKVKGVSRDILHSAI